MNKHDMSHARQLWPLLHHFIKNVLKKPHWWQVTVGNGHESWHVPSRARKYSEHSDSADMSTLHSPAGDLHSEVLSRQHSDQVWPLKTSGSHWAPPHWTEESKEADVMCEVKEFKGGITAAVPSKCIVKIRSCWADLTLCHHPGFIWSNRQKHVFFFNSLKIS